jgi:cytochrome c biogenesis protein CcmG/thiol:disulfide interchange protein DsbE
MRHGTLLLLFCACLSGQPVRATRDLTVSHASDAGTVAIHLRNEYSSAATAWILQCETPPGGSRYYWNDQELSFESKPVPPGGEIDFKIPPRRMTAQQGPEMGDCEDFRPIAAVFADGTVSGDLRWINAVVAERREAYQDIGKASEMLNAAIAKNADTASVIQQLTDWQKERILGGMPTPRPSANAGTTSGWQSKGNAPPAQRSPFRSPVAGAARWLIETQGKSLPEAVKALAEWRDRLAKLAAVAETGAPAAAPNRMLRTGPFTPPSEPDLLGKPAPGFTLKDVDGREVTLASLRGKPVLLDFWATWCEPCREEMPYIQKLSDQFKDKGLVVVAIDTNETAEKARKYFEEHNHSFVNLVDSGEEATKKYGGNSIPRTVLIDKEGVVRYVHVGWGTGMDLASEVKKIVE